MNRRHLLAVASAGVLVATLAGCGGDDNGSEPGGDNNAGGQSWILGTTETVTAMDPAGSYDFGSWNMQYNIFEQLMRVPAGESAPVGDAAESCEYTDPQTIECTLREGLTFSNGHELTSSDVKHSIERVINIADPNGASGLLATIFADSKTQQVAEGAIETPDDRTVVFNLNRPDQTFLKVLSTAPASIVDEELFPADSILPDDQVVGSGPFKLSQYQAGDQAVLEANESYSGERTPASDQIFISFFKDSTTLRQAIENEEVDVAWRTLSPTDLNDLKTVDGLEVIEGGGSEFRYWVFDTETQVGGQKAVRQAVAQLIDRETIAQDAYDGTVTPSYSIVPPGFGGQKDSFKEKYGEPSVEKAEQILNDAGVQTPVDITLGYTPTHYGPNAVDEANELAAQLNESGLFNAEIKSAEWEQYQTLYKEGAYDAYILGWYPDFLDADNYLSPFLVDGGFYANGYSNERVNELVEEEQAATDPAKREEIFGELQDIVAEDVPLVPSWNGQNVAVATDAMDGVEETLDPTYIFRNWLISKNG